MPNFRSVIRTAGLSWIALVIALTTLPVVSFADPCTPPDPSQPGVHTPLGADAGTFVYQCDGSYAGQWINDYYVYNPDNNSRSPRYDLDYQYNCATGKWTMANWFYMAADGLYHYQRVASGNPGLPTGCEPAPPAYVGGTNINGTGPNSTNTGNNTLNNNLTLNNATGVNLNNQLIANATTGNAGVLSNTNGGNATSGNADDMATILNMLQSSSDAVGAGKLVSFVANIDGDVDGDFLLDPATLNSIQNTGSGSLNSANTTINDNLTVNNGVDAAINNTIDLTATSGDATVANNTNGGNAKTGTAKTIANVVNMINSALTAGHSFVGVININGNLNGDILLPPDFIDQLIAANVPTVTLTGPGSSNSANSTVNNNTTVNNNNTQGITNNINSTATSGTAAVTGNTTGGNATTGNAKTSITAFNLTGSNVIGANDILVFVNVTGKWYGLIVNAPPGATAASLGGHISNTGPSSLNTTNSTLNHNAALNNDVNQSITNNITTRATSGNATVSGNTHGGDATSGDAESAINLLNMENSTLDLSGWFGILFINVFGTWNGSFGINTAAGNPVTTSGGLGGSQQVGLPSQLFAFLPHDNGSSSYTFGNYTITDTGPSGSNATVLAAAHKAQAAPILQANHGKFNKMTALVIAGVILFITSDALYARRQNSLNR